LNATIDELDVEMVQKHCRWHHDEDANTKQAHETQNHLSQNWNMNITVAWFCRTEMHDSRCVAYEWL